MTAKELQIYQAISQILTVFAETEVCEFYEQGTPNFQELKLF